MKKLLLSLLLLPLFASAQPEYVEQMPEFHGSVISYFSNNIKFTQEAADAGGVQAVIYFTVSDEGLVKDVEIKRSSSPTMDTILKEIAYRMPKWKPGKQSGRATAVRENVRVDVRYDGSPVDERFAGQAVKNEQRPHVEKIWERLDTDSVLFYKIYGTPQEYQMQENFRISSGKLFGYRLVLVGMKFYWIGQLLTYLSNNNYSETDMKKEGGAVVFYFEEGFTINKTPSKFKISVQMTKDERIGGITISGDADPLLQMFVGYWGYRLISYNELQAKGVITNRFVSDKITLSRKSGGYQIVVSKS